METILGKLAGRPLGLKLELLDPIGEAASNGQHPPVDLAPETVARTPVAANGADATPVDPAESFKNDPLIQKALKIFEGEIRSVDRPRPA